MPIHRQLLSDTHVLGRFEYSAVLLHRNAHTPWVILVPEREETELFALPRGVRENLMEEVARAARFIQAHFGSTKINFAAIGNVVPQLHLHVVGRDPDDICWPAPVWGNLEQFKPYAAADVESIVRAMTANHELQAYAVLDA